MGLYKTMKVSPKPATFSFLVGESLRENQLKLILAMRPLHNFSFIFGLSPVTVVENKIVFSIYWLIYGFILIFSTSVARLILEPPPSSASFFNIVMHYRNLFKPVSTLLSFFFLVIRAPKFILFFNGTLSLPMVKTSKQLKLYYWLQICVIVLSVLIITATFTAIYMSNPAVHSGSWLSRVLLDCYLTITLWVTKFQFFICVSFLRDGLILINHEIIALQSFNSLHGGSLPIRLNPLMSFYDEIIGLVETLNDCYGVALTVAVLLTSLNCMTTAYYHFVIEREKVAFLYSFALAIDIVQLWIVIYTAESFVAEASRIANTVHKTMRMVTNVHLIEQLKQFSMFLIHRKFKFTICGMLPLDYSLLCAIAGTVTTYMVVLVQFEKSSQAN